MSKEYSPFDFMNAVSLTKEDIISNDENPEYIEKQYNAYIINRGFSYFEDTILHANEMNQRADMFNDGQFEYYRAVLRKRKRFSKWHKAEKNEDLDAIQEVYSCNRTIAKQYLKVLSREDMKTVHDKLSIGGVTK